MYTEVRTYSVFKSLWMGTMIWHFDSSFAVNYRTFGNGRRKLVDNAATNNANAVILL